MDLSNIYPFLDTLYQSPDLSEKQCRELYAAGGIAVIGLDESGRRIWFLKMTGDKGIVVNESGNAKLYKDAFTADVKLIWIKHGC